MIVFSTLGHAAGPTRIIPFGPASGTEFSGLALLAPMAMSVVLKAMDFNGVLITGDGITNPATVTLEGWIPSTI